MNAVFSSIELFKTTTNVSLVPNIFPTFLLKKL